MGHSHQFNKGEILKINFNFFKLKAVKLEKNKVKLSVFADTTTLYTENL
jgi:hypothetical protein